MKNRNKIENKQTFKLEYKELIDELFIILENNCGKCGECENNKFKKNVEEVIRKNNLDKISEAIDLLINFINSYTNNGKNIYSDKNLLLPKYKKYISITQRMYNYEFYKKIKNL